MNLMPRWNWLQSMTRPRAAEVPDDAADMGTAFGLDASFRDLPEPPPAHGAASATRCVSPLTGLPRN